MLRDKRLTAHEQIGFGVFLAAQLLALIWYLLGRRSLLNGRAAS